MTVLGLLGRITLPGRTESAACARAWTRTALATRHQAVRDDVLLLVSELVTNAVRHSDSARPGGTITLTLSEPAPGLIRIEVTDAGSPADTPHVRPRPDDHDENGRGLLIVQTIATAWGRHDTATGRTTWCEIPTTDHAAR